MRYLAILGPAALLGLIYLPYDLRFALINTLIGTILALSFVVATGMAGQISLMQMTIAGVAAVAMIKVSGEWGIPFPIAPILAVLVAVVAGVLSGMPALRVRGVQLAVVTLGAAYAFDNMFFASNTILPATAESGSVRAPEFLGLKFGINQPFPFGPGGEPSPWFGIFVLVIVIVGCLTVARLRRSHLGLRFLAVRTNERAAAAMGVNLKVTKLIAYAIAAVFAGVTGVISSYQFQGVDASQFVTLLSVTALAVAYLGGISSVSGAIIAGYLAVGGLSTGILQRFFSMGQFEPLIAGVGLIVTVLLNPEGISGILRLTFKSARAKLLDYRANLREKRGAEVGVIGE